MYLNLQRPSEWYNAPKTDFTIYKTYNSLYFIMMKKSQYIFRIKVLTFFGSIQHLNPARTRPVSPIGVAPLWFLAKRGHFVSCYHAIRQISYCGSVHLLNPITILQWYTGIYRKQIRYLAQTLHGMRDENWSERSSLSVWMIDIIHVYIDWYLSMILL